MKNSINFVATKNIVKSDRFVARSLYKMNADLVEELGGEVVQGDKCFVAKFKTVAKAKEFVANAKTHISKKTYDANRRTEPKTIAPVKGKGKSNNKLVTVTDENGNTYKVEKSALKLQDEKPKKGKGSSKKELTAYEKRQKARKMANEAFDKYVPYAVWKAKYDKILATL